MTYQVITLFGHRIFDNNTTGQQQGDSLRVNRRCCNNKKFDVEIPIELSVI